ncbi:MAG TPA: hypothetical protein PKY53_05210 [Clostridia bacterium]|nr:hypothetical protein [Clostridia bacterium]
MQAVDLNARVSKKTGLIIIISVIVAVVAAMIGIALGHEAYEKSTRADIVNLADFTETAPKILVYGYNDDSISVNISEIVKVTKNATFKVLSVKEKVSDTEYNIIDKSGANIVNVSDKVAKYVTVQVTNKHKNKQYMLILVAKSNLNNTIIAHNTQLDGNFLDIYNSSEDYILPAPTKTYTTDIGTYTYDFEGWYTSPDYDEESKIEVIPAGSSGIFNLYAKFKTTGMTIGNDGRYYYTMGRYPQTRVTKYSYLGPLRAAAEAALSSPNGIFNFDADGNGSAETYYRFKPENAPNVANNGYSPSSYYFFLIEPIEWVILTTGTPSNGGTYTLMTRKILDCSIFVDQSAASLFEGLGDTYQKLIKNYASTFIESIYGPESLWYRSGAKEKTDAFYKSTTWLTTAEINSLTPRSYTAYYTNINLSLTDLSLNIIPDRKDVNDERVYCLQYTDMYNTSFGFSADEDAYDPARRAIVTDFAKANGAYFVTNARYTDVGTYFLRGAGSTYTADDKRFAYVKYTGAVHCYTTTSWKIRSGIRPACRATITI